MKVRVSIPGSYMAVEMDEGKAFQAFRKMVELMCSYGAAPVQKRDGQVPAPIKQEAAPEEASGDDPEDGIRDMPVKILPMVQEEPEEASPPQKSHGKV